MCPNREVVLGEVVLVEEVLRAPNPKALLLLSPHVLRTDQQTGSDWGPTIIVND